MKQCAIEQCSSTVCSRGWCRKHYLRWYKHGDPENYSRFDSKDIIYKDDYALISLDKDNTRYVKVDKDSPMLKYNWCYQKGYASRNVDGNVRAMHLIIMEQELIDGLQVDHINRDKLDNRRSNLRMVSRSLNQINKVMGNNTTGYRGVTKDKRANKWTAVVALNKVKRIIYWGDSYHEAVEARKKWEVDHNVIPV